MGEGKEGHPQSVGQRLAQGSARQETGHVGALHRPGTGAGAHRLKIFQKALLLQLLQLTGQPLDVLEQGVALAQAQLTRTHVQQAPTVVSLLAVKYRR